MDRLLSNTVVRAAIGFEVKNGRLLTKLAADEAIKPLKKIVLDLVLPRYNGKKLVVTQVKSGRQQIDYVNALSGNDRPDLSRATSEATPVDEMMAIKPQTAKPSVVPFVKPAKPKKAPVRLALVPKGCSLTVTNEKAKILEIFEELRSLKLAEYPNAIAVLLRVFMELSVDHYLEKNNIPLKKNHPNPSRAGSSIFKSLADKIGDARDHMISHGANRKDFIMIDKALSDRNHPLSVDLQHAYVHDQHFAPNQRDLVLAWDNGQPFFNKIWP